MERGFIQTKLEIKVLVLYILARCDSGLDFDALTALALCDEGVTYFNFTESLAELVEADQVAKEAGIYRITGNGRRNGAATEDALPYTVCLQCDRRLSELREQQRREQKIHSSFTRQESGWWVELSLDGNEGELFHLGLTMSLREDAQDLVRRFRSNPEGFYRVLQGLGEERND